MYHKDEPKNLLSYHIPKYSPDSEYIEKLLHFKKYILSEKEERILSLQMQTAQTADSVFSVLTNVDMNKTFGTVKVDGKEWSARSSDNENIKTGELVKIEKIDGVKLIVTTKL